MQLLPVCNKPKQIFAYFEANTNRFLKKRIEKLDKRWNKNEVLLKETMLRNISEILFSSSQSQFVYCRINDYNLIKLETKCVHIRFKILKWFNFACQ